jgi:hypothetical protein
MITVRRAANHIANIMQYKDRIEPDFSGSNSIFGNWFEFGSVRIQFLKTGSSSVRFAFLSNEDNNDLRSKEKKNQ